MPNKSKRLIMEEAKISAQTAYQGKFMAMMITVIRCTPFFPNMERNHIQMSIP